jgi:hypothetical protein
MLSLNFLQIMGAGLWNFRGSTPLYPLRNIIAHRIVLTLRSLSGPRAPTDLLERFSSLPLLFVSGRFATFLFARKHASSAKGSVLFLCSLRQRIAIDFKADLAAEGFQELWVPADA